MNSQCSCVAPRDVRELQVDVISRPAPRNASRKRKLSSSALALAFVVTIACTASAAPPTAEKPLPRTDKIKFRDDGGKTLFSLKFKDNGAKLVDGKENELARYSHVENKIKIKDDKDKVLAWVIITHDGNKLDRLRLEAADEKSELFVLKRQADGDWKVEDPQQFRLYTLKHRDYGVEIKDAHETSLFKVKSKDGRTSLRTDADKSKYHTDEPISPAALGCLGLEKITDLRLRMALLFAIDHGPKHEPHAAAKDEAKP